MNWKTLFENQTKLDTHIEDKHPRQEGEDRLVKKVVAFQVELGEMANEWRGFKFWSERQAPKTLYTTVDADESNAEYFKCGNPECEEDLSHEDFRVMVGEPDYEVCPVCKEGYVFAFRPTNRLLEEFIDVVHFTASIGLELEIESYELKPYEKGSSNEIKLVQDLFFTSSFIGYRHDQFNMYNVLINCVDHLGTELGFTDEEIMEAYAEKNKKNFQRQESGY